jgi:hypothetical protein
MPVHVAFTPVDAAPAAVGVVIDVLRATSTIAQALASGYERVLCCAEIEDARALRAELPDSLLGGERQAVRVEGFDVGASPREFLEAQARTLILSTTNGTRAILETARQCDRVLLGSLLNLSAVARRWRATTSWSSAPAFRAASRSTTSTAPGGSCSCSTASERTRRPPPSCSAQAFPSAARRPERKDVRASAARGGHRLLRAGRPPRRLFPS